MTWQVVRQLILQKIVKNNPWKKQTLGIEFKEGPPRLQIGTKGSIDPLEPQGNKQRHHYLDSFLSGHYAQ